MKSSVMGAERADRATQAGDLCVKRMRRHNTVYVVLTPLNGCI